MRISDETLNTLNQVNAKLQGAQSKTANPRKRPRRGSLTNNETNPQYTDTRVEYPSAAKPVYLRLKGLHKKKLSLASNMKIMEGKLAKNCYPSSVDFRFNINSTHNTVLKDAWTRALRKCKTDMTLALIDDLQRTYNQTKSAIAKDMAELETLLTPDQLQEIKESLSTKFKQMAPLYMEKKQNQFRGPKTQGKKPIQTYRRQGPSRGPKLDPKMNRLVNTLRSLLK